MTLKNYMAEISKKNPSVRSRVLNSEPFQLSFLCLLLIFPRLNDYTVILDIIFFRKKSTKSTKAGSFSYSLTPIISARELKTDPKSWTPKSFQQAHPNISPLAYILF